ncbi:MAG: hypothetical protein K0V04_40600 [Deltaproteobacteria bacterium]|nr:hypothetical protein [Deltaproteobacteria bacterium]
MSIPNAVEKVLPGLIPEREFVDRTYCALGRHGFANNSALAMVGVCRDELCVTLPAEIDRVWGQPFVLTGLGGYLTAGNVGFGAGHHHAPDRKPAAYVYCVMPHLGILDDGTLGKVSRPGMAKHSGACGALVGVHALLNDNKGNALPTEFDPADPEFSLLSMALGKKVEPGNDLLTVTTAAQALIGRQVKAAIKHRQTNDKPPYNNADYAILSGVQVHLESGQYIWDGRCSVRTGGKGLRKVNF